MKNIIHIGKLVFNLDNIVFLEPSSGSVEEYVDGKTKYTGEYFPQIFICVVGREESIKVTFRSQKFQTSIEAEESAQQIINQALTTANS